MEPRGKHFLNPVQLLGQRKRAHCPHRARADLPGLV